MIGCGLMQKNELRTTPPFLIPHPKQVAKETVFDLGNLLFAICRNYSKLFVH